MSSSLVESHSICKAAGIGCHLPASTKIKKSVLKIFIMKKLLLLLLITGSAVLSHASQKQQCCPNGEIITGSRKNTRCGYEPLLKMNCTAGRLLLKEIILNGDKVSTEDSPDMTFVEDVSQYCIGRMYRNENVTELGVIPIALVCYEQIATISASDSIENSGILPIISVFFLFATLAIYVYLPQMRDLQGMCYMCMCVSMAFGFLSLGVMQLSPGFREEMCTFAGFSVYFWMMATFFWMNVISINMFRSVLDSNYMKKTERKQYLIYSCYAWGSTLLLLCVSLIANFVEGEHVKPGIGFNNYCWFSGRAETWLFFYGPIAILITANIIMFVVSSIILWQQTRKYEVNNLNVLKHKFLLSLKLFLVMGISWIFEIASFAHGKSHIIWRIMDTFNCLQGVVIFLLLVVFRRRAIQGLARENCCLPLTRPLAEKLSPHDDADDEAILGDETTEVRLN